VTLIRLSLPVFGEEFASSLNTSACAKEFGKIQGKIPKFRHEVVVVSSPRKSLFTVRRAW
jgi:hypothetical protein